MDYDVNKASGVQAGQAGDGHLTNVLSTRFIGGVLQVERVTLTCLLPILKTTRRKHNNNELKVAATRRVNDSIRSLLSMQKRNISLSFSLETLI